MAGKFWNFIKKVFQGFAAVFFGMPTEGQKLLTTITNVVNKFKILVFDSGTADIITALIAGIKDDELKEKIRAALTQALDELVTSKEILSITDPVERQAAIFEHIRTLTANQKVLTWINLGALLTKLLTNNKVDLGDAAGIQQAIYKKNLNLEAEQHIIDSDGDGIPDDQDEDFQKVD